MKRVSFGKVSFLSFEFLTVTIVFLLDIVILLILASKGGSAGKTIVPAAVLIITAILTILGCVSSVGIVRSIGEMKSQFLESGGDPQSDVLNSRAGALDFVFSVALMGEAWLMFAVGALLFCILHAQARI